MSPLNAGIPLPVVAAGVDDDADCVISDERCDLKVLTLFFFSGPTPSHLCALWNVIQTELRSRIVAENSDTLRECVFKLLKERRPHLNDLRDICGALRKQKTTPTPVLIAAHELLRDRICLELCQSPMQLFKLVTLLQDQIQCIHRNRLAFTEPESSTREDYRRSQELVEEFLAQGYINTEKHALLKKLVGATSPNAMNKPLSDAILGLLRHASWSDLQIMRARLVAIRAPLCYRLAASFALRDAVIALFPNVSVTMLVELVKELNCCIELLMMSQKKSKKPEPLHKPNPTADDCITNNLTKRKKIE